MQFAPGTMYICFNEVRDEDCLIFENISATTVIINLLKISRIFSKFIGSIIPLYHKGIKIILIVTKDSFLEKLLYRFGIQNVMTMYHSLEEAIEKEEIK
jgi:hypothetical protein